MKQTPYMKGYNDGKTGGERNPQQYTIKSECAAYIMGYSYGKMDREEELKETA